MDKKKSVVPPLRPKKNPFQVRARPLTRQPFAPLTRAALQLHKEAEEAKKKVV